MKSLLLVLFLHLWPPPAPRQSPPAPVAYAAGAPNAPQWVAAVSYANYIVSDVTLAAATPLPMTPRSLIYRNGCLQNPYDDWTPGSGTFTMLAGSLAAGDKITVVTFQ